MSGVPAPAGLRRTLRDLPRAAWVLYLGSFVNRFGSFVLPFLVLYLIRRGYTAVQAGAVVGLYGVGSLLASVVGGYLADRVGRRSAIAISMFTSAAILVGLSQAQQLAAIAVLTALAGLTAELYRPASSALLADLVPLGRRVTAFALYRLAINAGFAMGPAAAGFLADRSFLWLFWGDALTSAVFGVLAVIALPERPHGKPVDEHRGEAIRAILHDPIFLRFLAASILAGFVYVQSTSTFALHVRDSGFRNAVYGSLISLNGLMVILLELAVTSVTQRLRPRRVIAGGMLLVGVGFGLTALAHTVPVLALTVVVWTLGEILSAPVGSAYVADIARPHLRGRYQGAWGLTWGLAAILAPVVGTRVYAWNASGFWLLCAGLGGLAAGLVLVGREPVRPTA
jgi:MFS family permease